MTDEIKNGTTPNVHARFSRRYIYFFAWKLVNYILCLLEPL